MIGGDASRRLEEVFESEGMDVCGGRWREGGCVRREDARAWMCVAG